MANGRTWLLRGIYLILITLILLVFIVLRPARVPSDEEIAKRGSVAPLDSDFSIVDAHTWRTAYGSPRDWIDQGMDSFMSWDLNPWKVEEQWFGQHFESLRRSKNPNDQAEYQRLRKLGREWHQRILSRYPELANRYRNVPDERNALKKLADLEKRFRSADDPNVYLAADFPKELRAQLFNGKPWDSQAATAWLEANRSLVEEIRAIGLMTESSTKGLSDFNPYRLTMDFTNMLLLDARVAADRGDINAALDSIRAANGLAGHLSQTDAPTIIMSLMGYSQQRSIRDAVFASIMPGLPASQIDLTAFENALNPRIETPAAWANTVIGEWNGGMSEYLLPSLADPTETRAPHDAELFAETYTNHMLGVVRNNQDRTLSELPTHPDTIPDLSQLSLRSRSLLGMVDISYSRKHWEHAQVQAGLTKAAFAILRGQPVPNDPIHGKPYTWDPITRQLSLPAGVEYNRNKGASPLVLPKL